MKKFFLAGAAMLLSVAAGLPQAQAASIVLKSNGAIVLRDRHHVPPPPRFRRHHKMVCTMKTVRHYRNHRLIIEKTKVCR